MKTSIPASDRGRAAPERRASPGSATPVRADASTAMQSQLLLRAMADASPQVQQLGTLQAMMNPAPPIQKKPNGTGLPDSLKTGVENLSGYSLDDVKVHYNSDKPGQLQAHAYAQGTDIHVAPGQEKHLPHEAWHVVQQKQGRVKPTLQMKSDVPVNDDPGLEAEADAMGAKALQLSAQDGPAPALSQPLAAPVVQAVWADANGTPMNGDAAAKVVANPLEALATASGQLGLGAAAQVLFDRFQIAQSSGNTELVAQVSQALLDAWNVPGAVGIPFLLEQSLNHMNLPDDTMGDGEHEEDAGGGNAEEELEAGDLLLDEIPDIQKEALGPALATRQPDLYPQFMERAAASRVQPSWKLFLAWFNAGVLTRSQFASLGKPVQKARTPNSLSYQARYPSTNLGEFTNVTYKLDGLGSIAFNSPHKVGTWQNPVKAGSEVQLRTGSAKSKHGITLNGTKLQIPGASRGQHFSMANRIMNNGWGSKSPDDWTWHHLTAPYKMVLVDRKVHAKHGHNGGVYVWT